MTAHAAATPLAALLVSSLAALTTRTAFRHHPQQLFVQQGRDLAPLGIVEGVVQVQPQLAQLPVFLGAGGALGLDQRIQLAQLDVRPGQQGCRLVLQRFAAKLAPAAPRVKVSRQARRKRVGMGIVGIKKPTGAPWAKTTSRSGRERKTDKNYRAGAFLLCRFLQLLTGCPQAPTRIYKFAEIVNTDA